MKFHFALLFVLCAHALARYENIKALKATATSTNVTLLDTVLRTNVKSTLFGNCISKANTRQMRYSSIYDPEQENSFRQVKVSKLAKGLSPLNWEKEIQCKDIFDCSRASKDYSMFQYNGQTCRMVNKNYADFNGEFCYEFEDYTKDIVYINEGVPPTGCPAHTDVVVGENGPRCLGVVRMDVPFDEGIAEASCYYHYKGSVYYDNVEGVSFDTIRNVMRKNKYQGDFAVYAGSTGQEYLWITAMSPINASYFAIKPQDPYFERRVVMSSSHDYLLVAQNGTVKITAFICLGTTFGIED